MTEEKRITRSITGNVGVLDLRRTSEKAYTALDVTGNVGIVLYSRGTVGLLGQGEMTGNVGTMIEVEPDAEVRLGETELTCDYFKGREAPLKLVVVGELRVSPDLPVEDIGNGLGSLVVTGDLICPSPALGAVQAKLRSLVGTTVVDDSGDQVILGNLNLDQPYLHALSDNSTLVVLGKLSLVDVAPNELLVQKLRRV